MTTVTEGMRCRLRLVRWFRLVVDGQKAWRATQGPSALLDRGPDPVRLSVEKLGRRLKREPVPALAEVGLLEVAPVLVRPHAGDLLAAIPQLYGQRPRLVGVRG